MPEPPRVPLIFKLAYTAFFHFWLPFVLLWLVRRMGYNRRALPGWTMLATALMLSGYFCLPPPPAPPGQPNLPVNVNYVYGLSDLAPQRWLPPLAYLGLMLTGIALFSINDALGKWLLGTYSVGELLLIRSVSAVVLITPFVWQAGVAAFRAAPRPGRWA